VLVCFGCDRLDYVSFRACSAVSNSLTNLPWLLTFIFLFAVFHVIYFGDHCILNEPIEEWPVVEVLIAFFSKGFPLSKAIDYAILHKDTMHLINDLHQQIVLQDRRKVYDLLHASGIDVPRHVYLSRDGYISTGIGDGNHTHEQQVHEYDDHIEINGVVINKPFVEKPVNADDHNISIYYPTSAGGGCKKLFRKIGNRSSEFYPDINEVRRDGSYIYEEFVETQGTDVKMYTVGPDYGHAEARKSPAIDGKVERNADGKEVRFPVILSYREKEIARRIVINFKQFVCGFDILRVQENDTHSVVAYVCDVNGWSFVKNSKKYYDDCAQILSEHMIAIVKPTALKRFSTLDPLVTTSLNRQTSIDLAAAARALLSSAARTKTKLEKNLNPSIREHDVVITSADAFTPPNLLRDFSGVSSSSMVAAATLVEGALPVRDFPANLTSEPASLNPSASSSTAGGSGEMTPRMQHHHLRSGTSTIISEMNDTHEEELRCVLAIIRHADRTPKQKLKVNMSEPHILRYFHEQ
jgi:Diphosphoinositol pentakisphosphate kinase 2 N-terminal domain/Histidine phosphatase superfamily (branch 2)